MLVKIMSDCPKYKCDNNVLLDCEHCKFIKQLTKTIRKNAKLEAALSKHIENALDEYSADNIDIAKDEITGNLDIIYHSNNNSFAVVPNICSADDVDIDIIKKLSDKYDKKHYNLKAKEALILLISASFYTTCMYFSGCASIIATIRRNSISRYR